jgi:hypothetical protein
VGTAPTRVALVVVACLAIEQIVEWIDGDVRLGLPGHLAPVIPFVAWLSTDRSDQASQRAAMVVAVLATIVVLVLADA